MPVSRVAQRVASLPRTAVRRLTGQVERAAARAVAAASPARFFDESSLSLRPVHGHIRGGAMLAKNAGPFLDYLVDPGHLGHQGGKDEVSNGQIYTQTAGFIDVGHMRNGIDGVKAIFDDIVALHGGPGVIHTRHGEMVLKTALPDDRAVWADVAERAAYDDLLGYEMWTYGFRAFAHPVGLGVFSSAFSPEDVVSNYVGVHLGRQMLLAAGDFNQNATSGIDAALRELGAVSTAETAAKLEQISGDWVERSGGLRIALESGFLLKRNFERKPWLVGPPSGRAPPAWLNAPLPETTKYFEYTHTLGARVPRDEWPAWMERIRADARARNGASVDRPTDAGAPTN